MKILLDECVPKRLREHLVNHAVTTVVEYGWSGIKNGALLAKAAEHFEVFITVDRNLSFQQNTITLPIIVIVLHANSNELKELIPLVSKVLILLEEALVKTIYHIK